MKPSRRAIIQIRHRTFMDMLNGKIALVLPDDAEFRDVRYDYLRDTVELLVQSETYDEVSEAEVPPTLFDVAVRQING